MNTLMSSATKYRIYGIALLVVIGAFVALCAASYNQAFLSTVPVHLKADRAGLQMYPGNRVQLRGVDVGEVSSVALSPDGQGADLVLAIREEIAPKIPANVGVELAQLTAFGPKAVELKYPAAPSGVTLAEGGTLAAGHRVAVEVNSLFDNVQQLLRTAEPAKVNVVLGGLAQALDGRGEKIGETGAQLATYLRKLNQDLPRLRQDFRKGADVAQLYAAVTPDLLTLLDNGARVSNTIVDQRDQLADFLAEVGNVADYGSAFFARNGDQLVDVLADALPTTDLLRKYSPEFECTIKGVDEANRRQQLAHGHAVPGIEATVAFEPGDKPYRNPEDRPVIGSDNPPDCYGLPVVDGVTIPKGLNSNFDKGSHPNPAPGDNRLRPGDPPLVVQLFGPQAGVPLTSAEKERRLMSGGLPR